MTNLLTWFGKYMLLGIAVEGTVILLMFLACIALTISVTGTKYVKLVFVNLVKGMIEALAERKTMAAFIIGFVVWPIDSLAHIYTNLKNLSILRDALNLIKES